MGQSRPDMIKFPSRYQTRRKIRGDVLIRALWPRIQARVLVRDRVDVLEVHMGCDDIGRPVGLVGWLRQFRCCSPRPPKMSRWMTRGWSMYDR